MSQVLTRRGRRHGVRHRRELVGIAPGPEGRSYSLRGTGGEDLIDIDTLVQMRERTEAYWNAEVRSDEFQALAQGKEIGHRIADFVDERTTAMLREAFPTRQELGTNGRPRPRSMGDVWIQSQGIYNPVNVKAGEAGKNGQPNMVSLTKLLDTLLARQIDSYYLLIVKMRIEGFPATAEVPDEALERAEIVPNVYLVDMLDYLPFVTFDSGPGQAMLKEKQFYDAVDSGWVPPEQPLAEKVRLLVELLEDGDRRLIVNRQRKMDRIRAAVDVYASTDGHVVTQDGLDLG